MSFPAKIKIETSGTAGVNSYSISWNRYRNEDVLTWYAPRIIHPRPRAFRLGRARYRFISFILPRLSFFYDSPLSKVSLIITIDALIDARVHLVCNFITNIIAWRDSYAIIHHIRDEMWRDIDSQSVRWYPFYLFGIECITPQLDNDFPEADRVRPRQLALIFHESAKNGEVGRGRLSAGYTIEHLEIHIGPGINHLDSRLILFPFGTVEVNNPDGYSPSNEISRRLRGRAAGLCQLLKIRERLHRVAGVDKRAARNVGFRRRQ